MASILRGDIYWADSDPVVGHEQSGHRPVLIISRELFNERSGTVIAVAKKNSAQNHRRRAQQLLVEIDRLTRELYGLTKE